MKENYRIFIALSSTFLAIMSKNMNSCKFNDQYEEFIIVAPPNIKQSEFSDLLITKPFKWKLKSKISMNVYLSIISLVLTITILKKKLKTMGGVESPPPPCYK